MAHLARLYTLAVSALYSFSLVYNIRYVGREKGDVFTFKGYAGKFKYLTFLNFCLQTIYFGLSVVNDVLGSNVSPRDKQKKSVLQKIRDCFHSTIIFPTGAFVVLSFWAIYAVDRELIYPKELDKIIPSWVNHVQHTTVLPLLIIDKILVHHEYPSKIKGILVILAFAATYLIWILWIAYIADLWVYPVLKVLEPGQKAVFIFFLLLLFISLYLIGEALTKFIWNMRQPSQVHHKQMKKSKNKQR